MMSSSLAPLFAPGSSPHDAQDAAIAAATVIVNILVSLFFMCCSLICGIKYERFVVVQTAGISDIYGE